MTKKENGNPPKTLLARSRELLSLAAKMGGKELGGRISNIFADNPSLKKLNIQIEQAQALVESLAHLRGAAMKAGQMLSIEARDFLPPEVIEILNKLQDNSENLSLEKIKEILNRELGEKIVGELKNLSPSPVASASIGQVHRAQFRDQDVALKIQFPGIASCIGSDIFVLRKISEAFVALSGKTINLGPLFDELSSLLKQEVDYINEATNMENYAKMLAPHPAYVIPKPIPELINAHVLGMTFEEGFKPDEWIRTQPSMVMREKYARLILDLYSIEFFQNGFVQTDPNFGNFFIRPQSEELVLLDFGSIKRFSKEFIHEYKKLLLNIHSNDQKATLDQCFYMKLLDPRESQECQDAFFKMMRMSLEPFDESQQPFDFGSSSYSNDVRKQSMEFTKLIRYSAPPHQILFLHRKLSGVFRMLQTFKVKIHLQEYWENFVRV
jgi:aarF domain-containing kinase